MTWIDRKYLRKGENVELKEKPRGFQIHKDSDFIMDISPSPIFGSYLVINKYYLNHKGRK